MLRLKYYIQQLGYQFSYFLTNSLNDAFSISDRINECIAKDSAD